MSFSAFSYRRGKNAGHPPGREKSSIGSIVDSSHRPTGLIFFRDARSDRISRERPHVAVLRFTAAPKQYRSGLDQQPMTDPNLTLAPATERSSKRPTGSAPPAEVR